MDIRAGFFVLSLLILGYIAALMVLPIFPYVMAACLLAFVLFPVQRRLEKRLEPTRLGNRYGTKLVALALTVVAVVTAVVPLLLFSVILFQTVFSFLRGLDGRNLLEGARTTAEDFGLDPQTVAALEEQALTGVETDVLTRVINLLLDESVRLLNSGLEMGVGMVVLVFLLYYFLVDGDRFVDWVGAIAPLDPVVRDELFEEIRVVTWAVIRSHVLVALVQGALGGLGLWVAGISNVAFWTLVMIVAAFLPAIGVWLVWGPAAGYLLASGETGAGLLLLAYGAAVLSVVDNYLRAIFVDRQSGVHPAVVLVGVIGGLYLLGIMGLFLGPVLLAVFKAGLNVFGEAYGNLEPRPTLAEEPAQAPTRLEMSAAKVAGEEPAGETD
ncbi:AI-2E family transporter [Natronosalvus rutilus]|uniref:AI-2E family transporter n=1 Tax=Natronosalvus rutilus TaxID=2953753 RepID=A0A9E7SVZ5_9EURY|nr:AI-2E family transporter [Natronosalvus rutilus]UTF53501.1 AI-2E family transporter [Natronosalvus rutilus]